MSLPAQPEAVAKLAAETAALWTSRDPMLQAAVGFMRDWLMPSKASDGAAIGRARRVGGLGLARLRNLRSLRSAQLAFTMRLRPDAPPQRERVSPAFGRRCLDLIARLRPGRLDIDMICIER